MLRDNPAGSSSRCLAAREAVFALHDKERKSSDDRPSRLENPPRRGGIYTNGTSLLHFTLNQDKTWYPV